MAGENTLFRTFNTVCKDGGDLNMFGWSCGSSLTHTTFTQQWSWRKRRKFTPNIWSKFTFRQHPFEYDSHAHRPAEEEVKCCSVHARQTDCLIPSVHFLSNPKVAVHSHCSARLPCLSALFFSSLKTAANIEAMKSIPTERLMIETGELQPLCANHKQPKLDRQCFNIFLLLSRRSVVRREKHSCRL